MLLFHLVFQFGVFLKVKNPQLGNLNAKNEKTT